MTTSGASGSWGMPLPSSDSKVLMDLESTDSLEASGEPSEQDSVQCLVCLDSILSREACALRCGHVFHTVCVRMWLSRDKSSCPSCKRLSRYDDLRMLDFKMGKARPQSSEALQLLESASEEERMRMGENAACEMNEAQAEMEAMRGTLEELHEAVHERKRARKTYTEQRCQEETTASELHAELTHASERCAELQAYLDSHASSGKKLSVPLVEPDDLDLRDERMKLRSIRPDERALQLHEALVSARRQEGESRNLGNECTTTLEEMEAELNRLRRLDSKLRRELSERNDEAAAEPRSRGLRGSEETARVRTPDYVAVELVAPVRPVLEETCDTADLLYGGAPLRRTNAAAAGGGRKMFGARASVGAQGPGAAVENDDSANALFGAPVHRPGGDRPSGAGPKFMGMFRGKSGGGASAGGGLLGGDGGPKPMSRGLGSLRTAFSDRGG